MPIAGPVSLRPSAILSRPGLEAFDDIISNHRARVEAKRLDQVWLVELKIDYVASFSGRYRLGLIFAETRSTPARIIKLNRRLSRSDYYHLKDAWLAAGDGRQQKLWVWPSGGDFQAFRDWGKAGLIVYANL